MIPHALDIRQTDDGGFKRLRHATDPYRSFVRSFVRSYVRTFVRTFVRSFVRSFFRSAVYPPRMAPIGMKLCQNAFQTIPDI